MAIIGMDIHGAFAEVVALEGKSRRWLGQIDMRRDAFEEHCAIDLARAPDPWIPRCELGRKGRALAIGRHIREIDRLGEDLKVIQRDLANTGYPA